MARKLEKMLDPYRDVGTLCLRLALGIIFMTHGSQKLFSAFGGGGLAQTGQMFAMMGFQPGIFWATLTACTEFFGGLGVFVGLLTRLASLGLGIVMFVAMLKVHLPNGFFLNFALTPGVGHGIEYNVALLGASLALFFGGAGKWSLDAVICKEK